MTDDLPAIVASLVAGRSIFSENLEFPARFIRPSTRHGRSLAARLAAGNWLSVKGCGWTLGPPWVISSPKDHELCFGLLDANSAVREVAVSHWLEDRELLCARSLCQLPLTRAELRLLGVDEDISFLSGRMVTPSALLTISSSAYRVNDLLSESSSSAIMEMCRVLDCDSAEEIFDRFAVRLLNAITRYQSLGAVNDTLGPENVVVSGEVTDFEWFHVPEIPLPDGTTDSHLIQRQLKEAFYFVDTLVVVAAALGLRCSIQDISRRSLEFANDMADREPPILRQLRQLADSREYP